MIQFTNVSKQFSYRGRSIAVVSELTLTIARGTIQAVVGPNGAGKTTALRMLTTVMQPTTGNITVQGLDTRTQAQQIRSLIGYVPQQGSVTGNSRVEEELIFQGALLGMTSAHAQARAKELLEIFDLGEHAIRHVQHLSGGQKRRVDLALALMHSPQVLVLDEPTVGLDPQSRAHLWERIRDLVASFDITVALTTHYLEEAAELADRIALIDRGSLIAEGTPAELISRYATDTISVGCSGTAEAARAANALSAEYGKNTVEGDTVLFTVDDAAQAAPHIIARLMSLDVAVTRLKTAQGSLDDVFFTLTGRNLRD